MRALFISVVVAGVVVPTVAEAQFAPQPARLYLDLFGEGPPADPNRQRKELTLTGTALGGFDDYITLLTSGPVTPPPERQSGYTGVGEAMLTYWVGRQVRSLSAEARGFATAYSVTGIDQTAGGHGRVQFQSNLGQLNRLDVSQVVGYQPTLVLGAFAPLAGDVDPGLLPDAGQTSGFVEQRSWVATSAGNLERRWTARQASMLTYTYERRNYLDDQGLDNTMQGLNAQHIWACTRDLSLQPTYRFSDVQIDESTGTGTPVTNHDLTMGLGYVFRLSPTRQVQVRGGAGATYVSTVSPLLRAPVDYWTPSGYGSVDADIGMSWSISANYRRGASVLSGVSVQTFATDAAAVQTDGLLGRRTHLTFTGGYSNGRSDGGVEFSHFVSYGGIAQVRYALERRVALVVNYSYYNYRLRAVVGVPEGVPAEYDRNAVQVGVTFWVPLSGPREVRGERRPAGGR